MIKSMTGYGRARMELNKRDITVEVRSVNNRYLDCTVKMPRMYIFAEDAIKSRIQGAIARGKLDVFVTINTTGGVASGPMTAAFLLPFAMGACKAVGGNPATDAFGVVAFVAMTPLIAVQIPGLIWHIRNLRIKKKPAEAEFVPIDDDIIDL